LGSQEEGYSPKAKPSLSRRLRVAATLLALLFFSLVGFVIDHAYQVSLLNAVESRLQAHIYTLLTLAEVDESGVYIPDALAETRFNQFDSGLYAFVLNEKAEPVWKSKSSVLLDHIGLFNVKRNAREFVQLDLPDAMYNSLGQGILWQDLNGDEIPLTLWVLEDSSYYKGPLIQFRWILWSGLILVAILLHFGLWALMYWALIPLNDLARDVRRIESGALDALSSNYPRELRNVSQAFNMMVAHERQQIDRYKLTLADLAHSLKTPLSVIKALVEQNGKVDPEAANDINHQINRMNQSVSYHLKRPVHQRALSKQNRVLLSPCVYRVLNALSKVYSDKNVELKVDIDETLVFPGAEDDLFELLGNLLENGFKYGQSKLSVFAHENKVDDDRYEFEFYVDDDGPGIPLEKRRLILKRGVRLDSQEEGQGLGLALVKDILQNYSTKLEIGDSPLGGARFKIKFSYVPLA
tara:strand:+ start:81941 stop:83341 length:1401 start_codon:yes stop_codon:yes gene_type:complete